jgi:DUF1680 family protein
MQDPAHRAVVTDTSRSPHARLRPVPLTHVTVDDNFWAPRRRLNREVSLPAQYRFLEETGRLDNFRRVAGTVDRPFQGRVFNDSDVYKWFEAAAWTLATGDDPALARMAEAVVEAIAAVQQPDGYLNTYFSLERAAERWTNLRDLHELYCAGHLLQAAIADHRATGRQRLLQVACRLADHVCDVFGPAEEGKRPATPGHEEIEMALVELARETGEARYLAQALFFLDQRGRGLIGGQAYHQDHRPFRTLERLEGHAVRHMYLNCGAADLYAETGEPALLATLERLWEQMTQHQMYVSGGLGAHHAGEAFGPDYELPNARAYAETCAAIGSVLWNWRMLALAGEARYADLLELTLYNGFLAGVSLDGTAYFYENPLAAVVGHRRQTWFDCACCPPNVARLLASLPGYVYSTSEEGIWVHLYAQGAARIPLADGRIVHLRQQTRYPWEGQVEIEVEGEGEFSLFLRLPGWCETGASLKVNGQPIDADLLPSSYVAVRRTWLPGDSLRLNLAMPVRQVQAHPYALENTGRVALTRGPLLYCLEGTDHPQLDLRDLALAPATAFTPEFRGDLLGGVVVLQAPASVIAPPADWSGHLYRTASETGEPPAHRPVQLTAIPYYAWANREPGPLQVWLQNTG